MKKSNIIYLIMALLAFSIIFSGCSPDQIKENENLEVESDVNANVETSPDLTLDETIDEELVSDDDVEIGELI